MLLLFFQQLKKSSKKKPLLSSLRLKFSFISLCKINSGSFVALKQYFAWPLHSSKFFNGGSSKADCFENQIFMLNALDANLDG